MHAYCLIKLLKDLDCFLFLSFASGAAVNILVYVFVILSLH